MRKPTIQDLQMLAERRGGKCLSEDYLNSQTKLTWQCAKGHTWKAIPSNIKQDHWCPYCAGKKKWTIKQMQELAEKRGGKCLSEVYINNHTRLLWECGNGHKWQTPPINVIQGRWCPSCASRKRAKTIEQMRAFAKSKGGKCLSTSYVDSRTKLLWECAKGHTWETSFDNIRNGHWCSVCAENKKQTIEQMQELAEKRGGKCLSTAYERKNTKLLWECSKGHRWRALSDSIKRGTWCWQCYLDKRTNKNLKLSLS
jgi:hypothetical protein